jgi:2-methylisocitrate lyase-like PEP mutase family enzyme
LSTRIERLAGHAERLRQLLLADELLVLPNVWDAASARLVAELGYPAIATASAAVTAALGHADDDSIPPEEMFAAVGRIARAVELPVTADLEAGYRLAPADLVARLLEAGAVGMNLEDTDHHGGADLVDAAAQAERLGAVKRAGREAGVDLVLNARVDSGDVGEAIARAHLYRAAGADCVYPINLPDTAAIRAFVEAVDAPVNVYLHAGSPPLSELEALGVARVSFGPGLQRVALDAVRRLLAGIDPDSPVYPI